MAINVTKNKCKEFLVCPYLEGVKTGKISVIYSEAAFSLGLTLKANFDGT